MLPMTNDLTPLSKARGLIDANNHAVTLLRNGCLIGALDVLCKATNSLKNETQTTPSHATSTATTSNTISPLHVVGNDDDDGIILKHNMNRTSPRRSGSTSSSFCDHHQRQNRPRYLYDWVDCSQGVRSLQDTDPSRDGYCSWGCSTSETSSLFLCLHAIEICKASDFEMDDCVDCDSFYGIEWALSYNFGVVNSLIGFRLGDKGRFLLERAHDCFKRSQSQVPMEGALANVYLRLLVSALNNELFCLLELGLYDESCACLHQMIDLLQICGPTTFVGRDDFERQILLNLLVLSKRHILAAAA